jgi:hypothetical protein
VSDKPKPLSECNPDELRARGFRLRRVRSYNAPPLSQQIRSAKTVREAEAMMTVIRAARTVSSGTRGFCAVRRGCRAVALAESRNFGGVAKADYVSQAHQRSSRHRDERRGNAQDSDLVAGEFFARSDRQRNQRHDLGRRPIRMSKSSARAARDAQLSPVQSVRAAQRRGLTARSTAYRRLSHPAARLWERLAKQQKTIRNVKAKREEAVALRPRVVERVDDSPLAFDQAFVLETFYATLAPATR